MEKCEVVSMCIDNAKFVFPHVDDSLSVRLD